MAGVSSDYNPAGIYPALAHQWRPTRNKTFSPHSVPSPPGKFIWWLSPTGSEWKDIFPNLSHSGAFSP
jgi:hypothetical protein